MASQPKSRPQDQKFSVPLRRSARLQSKHHSISLPHNLKQQLTNPETLYTHLPTSNPIEALVPGAQLHEYSLHNYTYQTQKLGSVKISANEPPKRAYLTERNLEAFEKMGQERESSRKLLQDYKLSKAELDSSCSEAKLRLSATSEASSKTVSSTDSRFPILISRNGIIEHPNAKAPANLVYLQEQLDRAQETASPTESEYQAAAYKIQTAENEQTVLLETSKLLKDWNVRGYRSVFNQLFKDFPKNVGFNNGLSAAKPDMVEGLDLTQFDRFPVCEELSGAAVPSSGPNAITLPHLAGEWKGPGKDMIYAQHQAAYDGASMVFARDEARSYLGNPDPAGYAFVSSFTTDGTIFNTFAHYSSESQGQIKYHQYPTSSSLLISTYEDFKKSRRRLRNLQDNAKEASEKLRDELNERWLANQQKSHGTGRKRKHSG